MLQYYQLADKNFPLYFERCLELFAVFKHYYVFNPRLLAEPPAMICGTLAGKHWAKQFF
jgi:hypothetical protein